MNDIQIETKNSPWYEDEKWHWYVKNTVSLRYKFDNLEVATGDRIEVHFYDRKGAEVLAYTYNNLEQQTDPVSGTKFVQIIIDIDEVDSEKLTRGDYVFCITYYGAGENGEENIKTICANQNVEVLSCH